MRKKWPFLILSELRPNARNLPFTKAQGQEWRPRKKEETIRKEKLKMKRKQEGKIKVKIPPTIPNE